MTTDMTEFIQSADEESADWLAGCLATRATLIDNDQYNEQARATFWAAIAQEAACLANVLVRNLAALDG